jgi:hypothetical protein
VVDIKVLVVWSGSEIAGYKYARPMVAMYYGDVWAWLCYCGMAMPCVIERSGRLRSFFEMPLRDIHIS